MFVLRRITSESIERNTILGESYVIICSERNPEGFKESYLTLKLTESCKEDIYGFISYNNGSKTIPLYKKSKYFIMTGGGATFANISFLI